MGSVLHLRIQRAVPRSSTRLTLCRFLQEEHKKLEDTEKKSRDLMSERGESIFWDVGEIMDQKENPGNLQLNMEAEELYVDNNRNSFIVHNAK